MSLCYPNVKTLWTQTLKNHLAAPLFSPSEEHSNVRFICQDNDEFSWNGLAYLGSLSAIFTNLRSMRITSQRTYRAQGSIRGTMKVEQAESRMDSVEHKFFLAETTWRDPSILS